MSTTSVLSYRWRTGSTHDDPNKWKPDSTTWTENETLGMVRSRIIIDLNLTAIDAVKASDYAPELWFCDENGNPTQNEQVTDSELLGWTQDDIEGSGLCEFYLKASGKPDKGKPKAFVLFTFPLKAEAAQTQTTGVFDTQALRQLLLPLIKESIEEYQKSNQSSAQTESGTIRRLQGNAREAPPDPYHDKSRHDFYLNMPKGTGTDGLDQFCIIDPASLEKMYNEVNKNSQHFLYLRSPPGSGKSTIGHAFALDMLRRGHIVYHLNMYSLWYRYNPYNTTLYATLNDYIADQTLYNDGTRTTWTEIVTRAVSSPSPIYMVIDEGQRLFQPKTVFNGNRIEAVRDTTGNPVFAFREFWETFKYSSGNLRVVFMSSNSYTGVNDGLPDDLISASFLGYDFLRLSPSACKQLAASGKWPGLHVHDRTHDLIYWKTSGNPNLVRESYEALYVASTLADTADAQCNHLNDSKGDFLKHYETTRPFAHFRPWLTRLPLNQKLEVLRVAAGSSLKIEKSWLTKEFADTLVESGMFYMPEYRNYKNVSATSHLTCDVLLEYFMTYSLEVLDPMRLGKCGQDLLEDFLFMSLARMDTAPLAMSMSPAKAETNNKILESAFQQAFKKGADTYLPADQNTRDITHWSEDGGCAQGMTVKIDFYLNEPFKFGIEFMREDQSLSEHLSRFYGPVGVDQNNQPIWADEFKNHTRKGEYLDLKLKHWALVYFKTTETNRSDLHENVWYVEYNPRDLSHVTVVRKGKGKVVLPLVASKYNLFRIFDSSTQ